MKDKFQPSYWELQTTLSTYDVAVMGGGIVGLNAAITLLRKEPRLKVIVVDRGAFPIGASTRNAGFACFGSVTEMLSDIDEMGYDEAVDLFLKRKQGLDQLIAITGAESIDLQWLGGSEVFLEGHEDKYERSLDILDRLNADLRGDFGGDVMTPADQMIESNGLQNVQHLIALPFEGQLHPGKLVVQLQKIASGLGARIVGGIEITHFDEDDSGVVLHAGNYQIQTRKLIIATNGFSRSVLPELALEPARNQVLVTKHIPGLKLKGCFHFNEGYVYFRNIDGRVLIGGARHIAREEETTTEFGLTGNISDWLEEFLRNHVLLDYPGIEFSWSGIMGVGSVKSPIIRMVGQHVAVAVRLGGMGVAIGSLVGSDAAELVLERI